jgi:hypothetical protein
LTFREKARREPPKFPAFVESHFYKLKHKLGYQRRRPATRITALAVLRLSGSSAICESDRSVKILPDMPHALAVGPLNGNFHLAPEFWSLGRDAPFQSRLLSLFFLI